METTEKDLIIEKFSTSVRVARNELNLRQTGVASLSGMSTRGYQDVESGDSNPELTTVVAISRTLDKSIDELVGLPKKSDLIVATIALLPGLNQKELRSIYDLASRLSDRSTSDSDVV